MTTAGSSQRVGVHDRHEDGLGLAVEAGTLPKGRVRIAVHWPDFDQLLAHLSAVESAESALSGCAVKLSSPPRRYR
jgi:hypothetical protein